MLEYNEIKPRKYIVLDDEPYEVIISQVSRKQANKPINTAKLRHLITGRVINHAFHSNDKVAEAELDKRKVKYLYSNRGENWFCEEASPAARFALSDEFVGERLKFIKPNSIINLLSFNGRNIGLQVPIKVELKVKEALPAVKGNTVAGGLKTATLETGAAVNVPLFVKEGEIIIVNTETGEYTERAKRS